MRAGYHEEVREAGRHHAEIGPRPLGPLVAEQAAVAAELVEQPGLGIKNFWSYTGATPIGDQKDMIVNSSDELNAINPLYISGATDSTRTPFSTQASFTGIVLVTAISLNGASARRSSAGPQKAPCVATA